MRVEGFGWLAIHKLPVGLQFFGTRFRKVFRGFSTGPCLPKPWTHLHLLSDKVHEPFNATSNAEQSTALNNSPDHSLPLRGS